VPKEKEKGGTGAVRVSGADRASGGAPGVGAAPKEKEKAGAAEGVAPAAPAVGGNAETKGFTRPGELPEGLNANGLSRPGELEGGEAGKLKTWGFVVVLVAGAASSLAALLSARLRALRSGGSLISYAGSSSGLPTAAVQ